MGNVMELKEKKEKKKQNQTSAIDVGKNIYLLRKIRYPRASQSSPPSSYTEPVSYGNATRHRTSVTRKPNVGC